MEQKILDIGEHEIRTIRRGSPEYPARLSELRSMPETLYVLGLLPSDSIPTVAIVGARMCSPYGHRVAAEFAAALALRGVQIISGMALGIDGYAQQSAVDAGGTSFAVLGGGVDICYPATNLGLYRELRRTGGILSEQPPGTPSRSYHFPARNRIISGLADIVLVVEARQRSGSLITADFALEQGRDVFAVPGRVGDALSDGCNQLIAQGASIACDPQAILDRLDTLRCSVPLAESGSWTEAVRRKSIKKVTDDPSLSAAAKRVFRLIPAGGSADTESLGREAGLPAEALSAAVMELVLCGYVDEVGKDRFTRSC
ncbi:MAG: DNA-processing protein DprA [Eubacteriales bacterium]|jgi:DNA processing protein|nr:DNA-processing protein DprA [Lachnospiraceae bacterium]MDD5859408.1 DNA-processing protein DprA [Eubacteriales bacterium]MCH4063024.1 DNA-processing protein DprA [Lachnospiraceae bacterium]MCH4104331.1 DNA-processing protein DprA [Lachnospiraceae bacterium]MCI1309008.1 DNA-processing protein DprA [Lachnospiraceae bacterium]